MYYSSVSGPFSNLPLPNNVVLTTPTSDNTTDIGTPTMRYRNEYVTGIFTTNLTATTITAQNVTASTNLTTPAITLNGVDLGTELKTFVSGSGTIGDIPQWSGTSTLTNSSLVAGNLVSGPASATNGNLAVFSGSSGKAIADGGNLATYLSSYLVNPPATDDAVDLGSASKRMRTLYSVDVKTTTIEATTPTFTNVLFNGAILEGTGAFSADPTGIAVGNTAGAALNSVAIGNGAQANFNSSVSMGINAIANAVGSVAIGPGATTANASSVAIGVGASASGNNSVCIGNTSICTQPNSVQLGPGLNSNANTVQIGTSGITNINTGSNSCDLANSSQPFVNVWAKNCRTLGMPSSVSLYSMFTDISVANTSTETNITTSASSIGSLILPAGIPSGATFAFRTSESFTSTLGDTITFRLYSGASVLASLAVVVPVTTSNAAGSLEVFCTVRSNSLSILMKEAFTSTMSYQLISFTPSVANTLSLTAKWTGAASTYVLHQLSLSGNFYNGA